ncbi:MAG: hypothetical protein ACK4U0_17275 [Mesorhizobium sp.]
MSRETDWTINNLPDPNAVGETVEFDWDGYPWSGQIRSAFAMTNGEVYLAIEVETGMAYRPGLLVRSARFVRRVRP